METLLRFLRVLTNRVLRELLATFIRTLVQLLLLIPVLLLWIWQWLCEIIRRKDLYPEDTHKPCGRLPEPIVRRPDPCIYSQRLLMSQGLPVTWNNPDIWIAPADDPLAIAPDSYHLLDNTDYIVTVQVHNASATDPAIGVRVRLVYRPWSFNSPDLVPVETDGVGNEVVRYVSIAPSSAEKVQFKWHTPPLPQGETSQHFCLQARLFHPMDTNPNNNMGQENTNVYRQEEASAVPPGAMIRITVPLHNPNKKARKFHFVATLYSIEEETIKLTLETTRARVRENSAQKLARRVPNFPVKDPPLGLVQAGSDESILPGFKGSSPVVAVRHRYTGYEEYKKRLLSKDYSPRGFEINANGNPLKQAIEIEGRSKEDIELEIKVPDDAPSGVRLPLNVVTLTEQGVLVGGITIIINVAEGF